MINTIFTAMTIRTISVMDSYAYKNACANGSEHSPINGSDWGFMSASGKEDDYEGF